jgi:DNA replication and repair protein RecF
MIRLFRATNFRCLENIELKLGPRFNLIVGPNASGKTSLLEALAYLGRGKSFRSASTAQLTRHGQVEFVLFGETGGEHSTITVGARNGRDGLEVRVAGENAAGAAALAEALPLQVIDPDVHNLIAGGPELRRRFLDWIAFHVEHEHLSIWRQFRRALKQRNAALKSKASTSVIKSWNSEFLVLAGDLDESRRRVLELTMDSLQEQGYA